MRSPLLAQRVVRVLQQLEAERGISHQIRVANGPELVTAMLTDCCDERHIELAYITLGKPQQNGFVERFNGSFRRELLDTYLFENLRQVRDMSWAWLLDYNDQRPDESLGDLPPSVYRQKLLMENFSLGLSQ